MSRSVNRNVKQRKIHMIILIVLILLCTILGGGYYLLKQTKENSEKTNRQKQLAQTSADSVQDSNTVEYKGETYKYNDHLSNYLFMGIDTRDAVDTYQTQEDAGQADAIFLVSLDRAEEKMKVLFIPRDTMTKIETFNPAGKSLGHTTDHINIQYAFGDGKQKSCELMKTAVSNLLDGLPKSDVLKFLLEDNCSIVVRPSGTEPKLKIYISVSAENKEAAEKVEAEIAKAAEKWLR